MKKIIFFLHAIITLAFTFMPLLFSWWINIIIYFIWEIHVIVFGGCVLTEFEYGKNSNTTFGEELLKKFNIKMSRKSYMIFSKYVQAPLCIVLSLILQKGFGFKPIFF